MQRRALLQIAALAFLPIPEAPVLEEPQESWEILVFNKSVLVAALPVVGKWNSAMKATLQGGVREMQPSTPNAGWRGGGLSEIAHVTHFPEWYSLPGQGQPITSLELHTKVHGIGPFRRDFQVMNLLPSHTLEIEWTIRVPEGYSHEGFEART
jgi:hypothetical protein